MNKQGIRFSVAKITILVWFSLLVQGCDQKNQQVDNIKLAQFYIEQGNDKLALQTLVTELEKGKNQQQIHRIIGDIFIVAEYYGDAIKHYQQAIKFDCGQHCVGGLIDAYVGQGDFALAEQEFTANVTDKNSQASRFRSTMIELYKHKDIEAAIEQLQQLNLPVATEKIMQIYLAQRNYQIIIDHHSDPEELSNDQLLTLAKAYFATRQYRQAENVLLLLRLRKGSQLLTPKKIQAVELLVQVNIALDKFEDAELIRQAFLDSNQGSAYASIQNTLTHLRGERFDTAIEEIEALAMANPDNIRIAQIRALAQFGNKNYAAVISGLERFKKDLSSQAFAILAGAYEKSDRPDDTIALLKDVERNLKLTLTLARAYEIKEENERALALLKNITADQDNNAVNQILAELLYDLGQFKRVITSFSNQPKQSSAIKYLVLRSYLQLKQKNKASQYAKRESNPNLSAEMLAFLQVKSGDLNAAIQSYQELIEKNPTKKHYSLLASTHLLEKDHKQALQVIRSGTSLAGDNRRLFSLLGRIMADKEDTDTRKWLESKQKDDKDYREVQILLANLDLKNNKYEQAAHRLALIKTQADPRVYYMTARTKVKSDPKGAVQLMEKALNLTFTPMVAAQIQTYYANNKDPDDLQRINGLIETLGGVNLNTAPLLTRGYFKLGQADKVHQLGEALIRQNHTNIGKELIADAFSFQGEHSKAAQLYEQLTKNEKSGRVAVKYYKSKIVADQSKIKPVLSDAESRLKKNPQMHDLRRFIATNYINLDNSLAAKHFAILVDTFPKDLVSLNNLAWINLDLDPVLALKYAEKAYQGNSDNGDIIDTYIQALMKNEQVNKARTILEVKLEHDPENQDIRRLLETL